MQVGREMPFKVQKRSCSSEITEPPFLGDILLHI